MFSNSDYDKHPKASCQLEMTTRKTGHTWLREVENDLEPLNYGLATAWRMISLIHGWRGHTTPTQDLSIL